MFKFKLSDGKDHANDRIVVMATKQEPFPLFKDEVSEANPEVKYYSVAACSWKKDRDDVKDVQRRHDRMTAIAEARRKTRPYYIYAADGDERAFIAAFIKHGIRGKLPKKEVSELKSAEPKPRNPALNYMWFEEKDRAIAMVSKEEPNHRFSVAAAVYTYEHGQYSYTGGEIMKEKLFETAEARHALRPYFIDTAPYLVNNAVVLEEAVLFKTAYRTYGVRGPRRKRNVVKFWFEEKNCVVAMVAELQAPGTHQDPKALFSVAAAISEWPSLDIKKTKAKLFLDIKKTKARLFQKASARHTRNPYFIHAVPGDKEAFKLAYREHGTQGKKPTRAPKKPKNVKLPSVSNAPIESLRVVMNKGNAIKESYLHDGAFILVENWRDIAIAFEHSNGVTRFGAAIAYTEKPKEDPPKAPEPVALPDPPKACEIFFHLPKAVDSFFAHFGQVSEDPEDEGVPEDSPEDETYETFDKADVPHDVLVMIAKGRCTRRPNIALFQDRPSVYDLRKLVHQLGVCGELRVAKKRRPKPGVRTPATQRASALPSPSPLSSPSPQRANERASALPLPPLSPNVSVFHQWEGVRTAKINVIPNGANGMPLCIPMEEKWFDEAHKYLARMQGVVSKCWANSGRGLHGHDGSLTLPNVVPVRNDEWKPCQWRASNVNEYEPVDTGENVLLDCACRLLNMMMANKTLAEHLQFEAACVAVYLLHHQTDVNMAVVVKFAGKYLQLAAPIYEECPSMDLDHVYRSLLNAAQRE